jgi:CRP-like cAMP-binding protein
MQKEPFMATKPSGPRVLKYPSPPTVRGMDGERMHNEILLGLPRTECSVIFSELEYVQMRTHDVLHEAGQPITHGYFVNSGLASVLNVMADGKSVEVGLAGKEGFIGLPLVVGLSTSPTRVVAQVAGSAFKIRASDFARALRRCPQLEKKLNRFTHAMTMQATQVAACNRVHEVEERLARWLLMSQDRLGGDCVPLTQEFLAHMLGTRRASVTVAAGILQKAGLIQYTRGEVNVVNRSELENATCECYQAMVLQAKNWERESKL